MPHVIPAMDSIGETLELEKTPEGLVEIPPALAGSYEYADGLIYHVFLSQVEKEGGPFFLHYRLTTTGQTICFMHFEGDRIKVVFPSGNADVLEPSEPYTVEDTLHGEGSVVVRFAEDVSTFKSVLMPVAVHLLKLELLSMNEGPEVKHEGRHFQPLKPGDVTFGDVIGLDEAKAEINRRMILPFNHPEVYSKYGLGAGGGILLWGPPGNGKTLLAKAVANELSLPFFSISRSDIVDTYVGTTEKSIRNLFSDMERYPAAVLFIDECESMFPIRGNQHAPWDSSMTDEFLVALDGVKSKKCKILVIGASNMPWLIDGAILRPGRLDAHVRVSSPNKDERIDLLSMHLRKVPHDKSLNVIELSDRCEGWSCAELCELVNLAKTLRAEAEIKKTDRFKRLRQKDLLRALDMIEAKRPRKEEKKETAPADPLPNEEQKYVADPGQKIPGYM